MSQQQQQHSQVFGSGSNYNPSLVHPQQLEQNSVAVHDVNHHFDLQRQQISNASMNMDFNRWQQYYSQISSVPHEMSSFIGDVQSIGKTHVSQIPTIQPSTEVIRAPQTLGAMLQSPNISHQQILFTQQSTSNNYMPDLASSLAAHQQYLLLAQQQQQYLEQQKQQIHCQQQIVQQVPLASSSIASTSTSIPYIHQDPSQQQQQPFFPLKVNQNTAISTFEHREKPQLIQKIKSPENPKVLVQKELEFQAKRKEQEDAKQSQLVQEDLDRRQLSARERTQSLQERLQSIPDPIHLAGCHTLSKVNNFIPFPSEIISSTSLSCFEQHQAQMVLSNRDSLLADYLGTLLSDSTDNLRKIELKKMEDEQNDQLTGISPIPPLIEAIQLISQFAFSVEPEPFENIEENEKQQQNNYLAISSTNEQLNKTEINTTMEKQKNIFDSFNDNSTSKWNQQINIEMKESEEGRLSHSESEDNENDDKNYTKKRSRKRRRSNDIDDTKTKIIPNRPPTPTEVIKQRELDWNERQRQREEKYKKQKHVMQHTQQIESWNTDTVAENESFLRFTALVDQIIEQFDEEMCALPTSTMSLGSGEETGFSIEKSVLEVLRIEAQKLKVWQKLSDIPTEKLVKFLTVLEKNIRQVLIDDEDVGPTLYARIGGNEGDETEEAFRELIDERFLKSVDAALTALCIMTSRRMPKQVLVEDIFERSVQLCKQCLQEVVYPNIDNSLKAQSSKLRKSVDSFIKKRNISRNVNTSQLYSRLLDLLTCFSELARLHSLSETLMIQLSSVCTPPFFVENVPEVQMQAIKLLPIIFAKCPALRRTLLLDLLNMLHKLPLTRNIRNSYRLSANESIGNFTVLILQLIQSAVQLPPRKTVHHKNDYRREKIIRESDDKIVIDSFDEAKKLAAFFLGGFLGKCTAKAEDDYRRLFEQFLQDILVALYRPMWPVAEMVLTVLGNLLVMHYRSKAFDLSLRVASLDYLGIITARLRKDIVTVLSSDSPTQEKNRLNSIVKSILFDENAYDPSYNVEDVDISHLSSSEKIRKLEQALFDYIIGTMWDGDVSVEYILLFYAVEWYHETVLDVLVCRKRHAKAKDDLSIEEIQKNEQRIQRIFEKGQSMKLFIMGLMDKQHLKRRMQFIAKNGNALVECDANWIVKYLASRKDLTKQFDEYLRAILEGFKPDLYPVAIRAKAMKCLAQIVEADSQVLMTPVVNKIVQDRLIDANASVREATFDLIGKCLVSKPELFDTYYSILINRTKDTAIAVRKRVVRILKDVVLLRPNYENSPQIISEIIQRINDEEGVKKMCIETFQQLWMVPTRDTTKLNDKVRLLVETTIFSIMEGSADHIGTLIAVLVKNSHEQNIIASKQLVDALIDYVLNLEKESVKDQKLDEVNLVKSTKDFQTRLFATLTILLFFAKARAEFLSDTWIRHIEVFMPYLSVSSSSTLESRVLNQIIGILEEIIPLMDSYNTSQTLIRQLDTRLNDIVKDGGMLLIASAISCMSSIQSKFLQTEEQPSICRLFIVYYRYLEKSKLELERSDNSTPFELSPEKKPNLLRALYSIGLMCRYFDFDILLKNEQRDLFIDTNVAIGSDEQRSIVRDSVFLILFYYSRFSDHAISQKALIALGQLAAGSPEVLRREELKSMYMVLLSTDKQVYLQLKVQVLKNIACFLFAEEQRALKRAAQVKLDQEQQSKQQEEDSLGIDDAIDEQQQKTKLDLDNLKEMELGSSGLSSSIIQQYWNAILKCYFHNDENVRVNSSQVIRQTLEQGLVTPGSSIPTLIAMSTDYLSGIRTRVEILIRDMNTKYKGLILSKAVAGIRLSFHLQKKIRNTPTKFIRGFRANENPLKSNRASTNDEKLPTHSADVSALLSIFYINVRANRQNRRTFLSSLLKIFSEETNETGQEEWVFLADNLAHFPYSVMDEPLYVIHQADTIISVSGQNILSQLRQLLIPVQRSSKDEISSNKSTNMEEPEEFSVEYITKNLPEDKERIYELKKNSHACFILLHLKKFLMHMYGFREDKVSEYSPSEPTNVYEKPVNRRNISVFSPDFIFDEIGNENQMVDGDIKIAQDFHKFHEMLLSLDDRKGEEETALAVDASVDEESNYF